MKSDDPARLEAAPRNEAARYGDHFDASQGSTIDTRRRDYEKLVNSYYDLATRFYVFGWGRSFHFAPLLPGRSLQASILEYEHRVGRDLGLGENSATLDIGCGIGGPMLNLAREFGARITGLNNNARQIETGERIFGSSLTRHRCRFVRGDFLEIPFPDQSFDTAYSLEAVCHAPDKSIVFAEVFRILQPGGRFVFSDWCLNGSIDPEDSTRQEALDKVLIGNGLPFLTTVEESIEALRKAGFEIERQVDLAIAEPGALPWYSPLEGRGWNWRALVRSRVGRRLAHGSLQFLEKLRLVPEGTSFVQEFLGWGADGLVTLGRSGDFSPLLYFVAVKPESNR